MERLGDNHLMLTLAAPPCAGYLYSQVFSADIYKTVFKADPMSSASGQKYREEILQPGGSRCVPAEFISG